MITDAQRQRLFAIAKSAGWTNDQIKRHLELHHDISSTKEIPAATYDAVCAAFGVPPVADADQAF